MSHPHEPGPQEPVAAAETPAEEPATEVLPATPAAEPEPATEVLPATPAAEPEPTTEVLPATPAAEPDPEPEPTTEVLPAASAADPEPTTELPAVDHEAADETRELPSPVPSDPTTELPVTTVLPLTPAPAAAEPSADLQPPKKGAAGPSQPERRFGLKTALLSLVVLLLLGVVGVLGGEVLSRRLLTICANEGVQNVLHTSAQIDYDRKKFLLSGLVDHDIAYLAVNAKNASVDSTDKNGKVILPEAIKGIDVSAWLENIHVIKGGGTVGHITTEVTWTADGISKTLANPALKGDSADASPIVHVNAVHLDEPKGAFTLDLQGKAGVLEARVNIVVRPKKDAHGNLQFLVEKVTVPGLPAANGFAEQVVRPMIQGVTNQLSSYPMNLKAKSVKVTSQQIFLQFEAFNAPLVQGTKCSALGPFA